MSRKFPCPLGRVLGVNYWTDCPEFGSEESLIRHLEFEHSQQSVRKTLAQIVFEEPVEKYRKTFMVNGKECVKPYHYEREGSCQ